MTRATLKQLASFLIFLIASLSLKAASKIDSLNYDSNFEKTCFEQFFNKKGFDTIGFLLATNPKSTKTDVENVKTSFNNFIERINTEGSKKRKNLKKFIDYLFEQVHTSYLKKYQENVPFDKIFSSGIYNCLTATALYAFIFERLGIAYKIKEAPTHVYIIADPGNASILIESTDPQGGYFLPDEKFKKQYVTELISVKKITAGEVASEGIDAIFEKNFYENESINFKQLVGLHYYNSGIALSILESHKEASFQLEKAYAIYPCTRISYVFKIELANTLSESGLKGFDNINDIHYYLKMFEVDSSYKTQSASVEDFEHLAARHLIQKDNEPFFNQVFPLFRKAITDSSLIAKIDEINYAYKGKAASLKGDIDKAAEYFTKAYETNPTNIQYGGIVLTSFANETTKMYKQLKTPDEIQQKIDDFGKKYPQLQKHRIFLSLKAMCLSYNTVSLIEKEEVEKSIATFANLKQHLKDNKMEEQTPDIYGEPYVKMTLYYIKKEKYPEAREWIKKGQSECANCKEIINRLKSLEDDLNTYHYDLPKGERIKAMKKDSGKKQ